MNAMTITPARCLALILLCCWIWQKPDTAAAQTESDIKVVVLHSYLISPASVSRLQQAADAAHLQIQFVRFDSEDDDKLAGQMEQATYLLVDLPHSSVVPTFLDRAAEALQNSEAGFVIVGDLDQVRSDKSSAAGSLPADRGVSAAWAAEVRRYYRFGGKQNTAMLIDALSDPREEETPDAAKLPAAKSFPEQGLYHPDWADLETDLAKALANFDDSQRPTIAIAINPVVIRSDDTAWLDALIGSLQQRQLNAYAFYGPRSNDQRFTQMTCLAVDGQTKPAVDLIINAALVFRPQQRKQELDAIGVPVLQTLPSLERDAQQWRNSDDGLALADISYYYASSELAGMVDAILISARNPETGLLEPLPRQIDAVSDKAAALCRLQNRKPTERRVAMIVYNYPPGESNFGASFLNVPRSLVAVLEQMKQAGYRTEVPDQQDLITQVQASLRALYDDAARVVQHRAGAAAFVSLADYQTWFDRLPDATRQRIEDYWGSATEMAVEVGDLQGFVIPGVDLGNVFVMPQPLRFEVTAKTESQRRKQRIGHQSTVPLSHHYLASYLYLRNQWPADAVVHFGTHGTLEWAPGKQRALSIDDDPLLGLGSLPNIYPYIMDNLGEATTAKRRGRATIVSHLTPMFTPAGFQPGLHEMHDLMHDWETIADGPVRQQIQRQLIAAFAEHHLDRDLGWTADQIAADFHGFMEQLHPYLDDIAQSAQPQGLAVLGEVPTAKRRFGMVMQMLRKPLIEALGEDIDEVFLLDAEKVLNSRPARWLRLALTDPEAASRLDLRMIDALDSGRQTSVPNRAADKQLDADALLALAHRARQLDAALTENQELASILAALDGKHIPSSYGGDPVRNPESLPTGRNLYGFDPTRVPTRQAWEIGVGVIDHWLATYREQNEGQWPNQIAFTMWAGETMRHQGVMEAEILHSLGVRPRWNAAGRMEGIEVVPAAELGRPRIDVLLSVTGSYRDQFPQLMHWIDEAVRLVAVIDEPDNNVAQHTASLRKSLTDAGTDPDQAARQATLRVFSNESGGYGTGLQDAVPASDLWDSQAKGGGDQELAELFVARMGFAYAAGLDGVAAADLFAQQLAQVDAAFLSRSSNTYGVLTSDDGYAYLGGLALAARDASGKSPQLFVQNLRDTSEVIVDSADAAISKEMHSRYLHPQWIKAQQAEGYSGTLQVLKATQFMWGWQVTAPETIREDQWQSMMDVYIRDRYELGTRDWLETDNQAALAQMLDRMLDAVRLGYWQPDDATRDELMAQWERATRQSDLIERNPLVEQYVAAQPPAAAQMPDPSADLAELTPRADADSAAADPESATSQSQETVQGMQLQPVVVDESVTVKPALAAPRRIVIAIGCLVFIMSIGAWRQYRRLSGTK